MMVTIIANSYTQDEMAGPELIGAISALSNLLEATASLSKPYNDPGNAASQVLGNHVIELQNILNALEFTEHEADLRTAAVLSEIESVRQITEKLVGGARSDSKYRIGEQEKEALGMVLRGLSRAKSSLGSKPHDANVGVTRSADDSVTMNMDALNQIDKLTRKLFGEDGCFQIATLENNPDLEDGSLVERKGGALGNSAQKISNFAGSGSKRTVLNNVVKDHAIQLNAPVGEESVSSKGARLGSSRTVSNNISKEQAIQLNAPIGEKEVLKLEIRDNESMGTSIQINHAISEDLFRQLLAHHSRRK